MKGRFCMNLKAKKFFYAELFFFATLLVTFALLIAVGVFRAYQRGGADFSVFYQAWDLVLHGRGAEIYRVSTDRYLYSPAFAWCGCLLALLSRSSALAVWCCGKILLIFFLLKKMVKALRLEERFVGYNVGIAAFLFLSRPILIDLEYGQINLFIMCGCSIALLDRFELISQSKFRDIFGWIAICFIAVAKIFPAPLLAIPWLVTQSVSKKKLRRERITVLISTAFFLAIPFLFLGWEAGVLIYKDWNAALFDRGIPLEAHNQSFTALLFHYASGLPTHVHSEGIVPLSLGWSYLTETQIIYLSFFWLFSGYFCVLKWLFISPKPFLGWVGVFLGLLIIPSHLIWKPYFVMSIPLATFLIWTQLKGNIKSGWILIILFFLGINFTGFDFIGHRLSAYLESASILLLMHLGMLAFGVLSFLRRSCSK